MSSPVSEISVALATQNSRGRDAFEYALYLSLSMRELCEAYFVHLSNTEIRNNIVKHILARRDRRRERVPRSFIGKLLTQFESSSKRTRVSLGTTLRDLGDSLGREQLRQFFLHQIMSEHVLDRKRAYAVAAKIYDQSVDRLLWDSWRTYQDDGCMSVLASNSAGANLAADFTDIWRSSDLRFSIKNSVLKRVAKHDFALVSFLKDDRPISYLSACVAAGKPISDEEAISIAKTADTLRGFQYALWCLGMLGKREALYRLLADATEVESRMPIEFWEAPLFEHVGQEPPIAEA
jgi:hypothetical protein